MEITRKNYEIYFIDYLEGNLNEKLVDEFLEFLKQNPDLKKELKAFKAYEAEEEEIFFLKKENLYKEKYDSQEEFNIAVIGIIEDTLSPEEIYNFQNYLNNHPEKEKDFNLFQQTKLKADKTLTFKHRNRLYKTSSTKRTIFFISKIAAIIVLFFSITILLRKHSEIETPESYIVKVTKIEKDKTKKGSQADIKKSKLKPAIKNTNNSKSTKSIREKTRGRVDEKEMIVVVRDLEIPEKLIGKPIKLTEPNSRTYLANMDHLIIPYTNEFNYSDERPLLAEKLNIKTGFPKFRFSKITKAGLDIATNISNNKFSYNTNKEGKITEYTLETRLLAFSIPAGNNKKD
jgi:hypothetical protein